MDLAAAGGGIVATGGVFEASGDTAIVIGRPTY